MLSVRCDHTGARALVFSSDVRAIHNTESGMVVRYRCACGAPGVMVTGSGAPSRSGHARAGLL